MNQGTIAAGTYGASINLNAGGYVDNAGGLIVGAKYSGILIQNRDDGTGYTAGGGAGTVTNSGTILGGTGTFSGGAGYNAVELRAGGIVSNTGLIKGILGVSIGGGAGVLINSGTIAETNPGAALLDTEAVGLSGGGSVSNTGTGLIEGVSIGGGAGVVINSGTINAIHSYGVSLLAGGSVNNGGVIEGLASGVDFGGVPQGNTVAGTVANFGTITGTNAFGVRLTAGGSVGNNGGLIDGYGGGVYITGGAGSAGTVNNSGTIAATGTGGNGVLVNVGGSVGNVRTILGGMSGDGVRLGGGGSVDNYVRANSLPLIEGGAGVFIYGAAGTVSNSGTIAGTGTFSLSGGGVYLGAGGTVIDSGTINGANGTAISFGGTGGNLLVLESGYSLSGGVSVAGTANTLELLGSAGAATVDFDKSGAGFTNFGTVAFGAAAGNAETLKITNSAMLPGTISGFTALDDFVDLTTLSPVGASATLNASDQLVVSNGIQSVILQLDSSENYTGITWQTSPDSGTGTDVARVCFCRGTRILTETGETAVEDLAVGDRVKTLSGALKPIHWIGFGRDLVTRRNRLARPIMVGRGALADNVPHRDLYLTHGHALYFDGVLIPVENLVNHRSILWDEAAQVVEYYHVELEDHDLLLAEGAPAESYYDAGNRAQFQNTRAGSEPGAEKPTLMQVLTGGELVDRIWAALFARAGGQIERDTTALPDLHLVVDGVRLDAAMATPDTCTFALNAAPVRTLRLCSRSGIPSLLGITRHDHRRLGVAVSRLELRQAGIVTSLDHDALMLAEGGCHPAENGYCWTDGELDLPVRPFAHMTGSFTVAVHTERPGMRYPILAPLTQAA